MLKDEKEVQEFVQAASVCPEAIDLKSGAIYLDAKSLLGIMNLGFNQTVNLKIYSNDCSELFHNIEKYKAA